MERNLYTKIQDAMSTDDEDTDRISMLLTYTYEIAREDEKKLIDGIFMSLCGWELKSLIKEKI